VRCAPAASKEALPASPVDIALFDPPYFDFISYSELSEFYRQWLSQPRLGGAPLLPKRTDPGSSFSTALGSALRNVLTRLKQGAVLAFTFHAGSKVAWDSVGGALDLADLSVTALWPVRNDSHMGHHTANGNLEWDLVVVCRRTCECAPVNFVASVSQWRKEAGSLKISKADARNMRFAIDMAGQRFAAPAANVAARSSGG
jgi:adenine-specific DNA methylase